MGHGSIDLDEAARQLEQAAHDAQVAYDSISLGDLDWAHTNAITARAEVDAAENLLRAVLGASGDIAEIGDGQLAARGSSRQFRLPVWGECGPVGADKAVTSCDLRILVEEAAKPVASLNADVVVCGRDVGSAVGWFLVQGTVRPVAVVVIDVFAEGAVEMSPAGDEDAVGALAPRAGDPPLADRVRPRRLNRRPDDAHADGGEDRVERVGVFGVPISDQELQAADPLSLIHERVPGLLHCPCGGGGVGNAGQLNAAVVVLDDEQHIKPAEKDGVDVEEVDRCDRLGLGG